MPELPEVETTKRGILPHLKNQQIAGIIVRQPKLRYEVPDNIAHMLKNQKILDVSRRAKYLIINLSSGYLLIHLGMSGCLRITDEKTVIGKHDHIDLILSDNTILRYNDPRRFGLWLYENDDPDEHRLLKNLGPEPLTEDFNANYLMERAKNKPIKAFIMDNNIVVGVGNIYATESLYLNKIHPLTPANKLTIAQYTNLCQTIKEVLQKSIIAGGTTLRDFYAANGKPGYFVNELKVYGKKGAPCPKCKTAIDTVTITGRTTAFCPECQQL